MWVSWYAPSGHKQRQAFGFNVLVARGMVDSSSLLYDAESLVPSWLVVEGTERFVACRIALLDLMAGEYVYIRSLGQSGFDAFSCDVFEEPEVSVASFSSLMSSPQSLGRSILESNSTGVNTTSQAALLSSGVTVSVRDTAGGFRKTIPCRLD